MEFKLIPGYELVHSKPKPGEKGKFIILARTQPVMSGEVHFVTWEYSEDSEAYWGHYWDDEARAMDDFITRGEPID